MTLRLKEFFCSYGAKVMKKEFLTHMTDVHFRELIDFALDIIGMRLRDCLCKEALFLWMQKDKAKLSWFEQKWVEDLQKEKDSTISSGQRSVPNGFWNVDTDE